ADLTLVLAERQDTDGQGQAQGRDGACRVMHGWLEYSTDLFDADTGARMARQFLAMLNGIAADPDLPLSAVPLLAPDEYLAHVPTPAEPPWAPGWCIHEWFEDVAYS